MWCLETCSFDVDVDLLFNEGLTIGKKIGLTEKIVSVLQLIECPHKIEPHQIQGLDFINIFPVVQWLVKKAMEARELTGDTVRNYAIFQHNKTFSQTLPATNSKEYVSIQKAALAEIKKDYQPKRKVCQNNDDVFTCILAKKQSPVLTRHHSP